MHVFLYTIFILIILIQYPLWLGKGSWSRVYELNRQVTEQIEKNKMHSIRNIKLIEEIKDIKEGTNAIEELARTEYNMLKENEIFIQIVPIKKNNIE